MKRIADEYVVKNGKKLRRGITTGSCASAAAKAAVMAVFFGDCPSEVEVITPKGVALTIPVSLLEMGDGKASFFVTKDSGDDPDITNGAEIHVLAEETNTPGIQLFGGKGVGVVTKPGLYVEVGQAAINPKPREMIIKAAEEALPTGKGAKITISVPMGEKLAEKTYNPRLGIEGGISILGTSGIVEPMSEEAIKDTIFLELKAKKAQGAERPILVPGNYGETFCQKEFGILPEETVKISNFVGFAMNSCVELGFKEALLVGHSGKLVKVAAGIWNTHSSYSDTRMEVLTAYLALMGMEKGFLERVMKAITTEDAIQIIKEADELEVLNVLKEQKDEQKFIKVFKTLADKAEERCGMYAHGELKVGIVIFSMKELLAIGNNAEKMVINKKP